MHGIGVSPGIVIGKACIKADSSIKVTKCGIEDTDKEIKRFLDAVKEVESSIEKVHKKVSEQLSKNEADIFSAHLLILHDPDMIEGVKENIKKEKVNAEWALKEVIDSYSDAFDSIDDEYMRERRQDVKDVSEGIFKILLNLKEYNIENMNEGSVIIAKEINPSEVVNMNKDKVFGFVTERGGKTSHAVIIAKTKEIPAVVGVKKLMDSVKDGDTIVFDGDDGKIFVNPSSDIIEEYKKRKEEYLKVKKALNMQKGLPTITKDGHKVQLSANIENEEDIEAAINNDAEGIGLYRTEFLFMNRSSAPSEEEQFQVYKKIAVKTKDKPVIIRTLDIGGDKKADYLHIPKEDNPFLGYRAIRLCLDKRDIFKTQLRAILRASSFGNVKIMIPMISCLDEVLIAKEIINEVKSSLNKEKIIFNDNIKLGIMIEVPSAAIISDILSREIDFFSIGTNDLIQYTHAVDRLNRNVANLYSPYSPSVLRLIKLVIDNAHSSGKFVGMCGEAASDPYLVPAYLGMGLDEFSMNSVSILRTRSIIRNLSFEEAKEKVKEVFKFRTCSEVEAFLKKDMF